MMLKRRTLGALLLGASLAGGSLAQDDAQMLPYGPLETPAAPTQISVKPRTVQLLDAAIRAEKDLPRRTLLVRDLGLCPVPESAEILKGLLADPEPLVRAGAVRSLANIDAADASTLAPLAGDASVIVQRELVLAKFAPAIVAGVKASDPALRAAALSTSVNETTDRAILDQLTQLDPPTQAIAIRTLGDRKLAPAADTIAKLLDADSVVVRVAAIGALADLGAITRPQIDTQLKHAHSAVRVAATRAASTLDEPARIAIAKASLADTDLAVRTEAAKLNVFTDASFVDTYFAQLPLGYEPLRLASRDALVDIAQANAQAMPLVTAGSAKRLGDAEADRRIDASFVLGKLQSTEGLAEHIKLLDDTDWRVVAQAARSLGPIGDASAAPVLLSTALRSTDEKAMPTDARQLVARAEAGEHAILSAVMLKHTPVLAATKKFYLNKLAPPGVRFASIYAAGVLGDAEYAAQSLRPLLGRLADPEESPNAIAEAIKAMGNARAKSMTSQLDKLRKDESAVDFQYAAHVALDLINGTKTPFEVKPNIREPDTSIRATNTTP